ncbi:MAG: hypothetical protein OEQ13_14675 [Acidobacteriota bacterium]|nr:hypothetical protein [Acidobacteriota bacterium]
MQNPPKNVRFAAPRDRKGWRLRSLAAAALSGASIAVAVDAGSGGVGPGTIAGLGSALGFGLLATCAFRRSLSRRPPLVIDENGVAVDNGLGHSWSLSWREISRVRLRRGLFERRVVIELREAASSRKIPRACHAGLPPEWLAGLLETFRERGGRLESPPPAI